MADGGEGPPGSRIDCICLGSSSQARERRRAAARLDETRFGKGRHADRAASRGACLRADAVPALPGAGLAQTSAAGFAREFPAPVSALINVPFQNNLDFGGSIDDDGFRYPPNFQTVVPIALNEDRNLISRTILPIVYPRHILRKRPT